MPTLSLSLAPEAVVRVHDALVCLAKFSESVSIEARRNKLVLTALNSSKSAYACFSFDSVKFFSTYFFVPSRSHRVPIGVEAEEGRFTCRIYNKALLSVFRGRLVDARERDTAIEKCDLNIQDSPEKAECRLIVTMICRHGVIKTYRLTYESVEVMHALFDKDTANNRWAIQSRVLREFVEHFGPKTEQLDIYSENGRATFTSYTEKIMDGKEILKQPLQTSVAIETLEFEEFSVQEKLHVAISVKDFKAIVTHADTLRTSISALYSQPTQPLQLAYQGDGMQCEFTLMTIGDFRGNSVNPAPAIPRGASARSFVGQNLSTTAEQRNGQNTSAMPPPAQVMPRSIARESTRQRERKPSPPAPKASLDSQSLFIPEDDDDRRWDEPNYGNEDEDTLGWDASADNDGMATSLERSLRNSRTYPGSRGQESNTRAPHTRLPPTQRVDEVPGLFD